MYPLGGIPVIQVHMPMDQIRRFPLIQQRIERSKAPVRIIFSVSAASGRRMGQHNVHPLHPVQSPSPPPDPAAHLSLRILVGTAVIAHASAQAQYPQAAHFYHLILYAPASFRGILFIIPVMVPMHIQQWRMTHGHQKPQVFRL